MSAESPRHMRAGGPLSVPAQPPPDRSIIDAVSGFINDVKLSSPTVDAKDVIQWARFETADINEPTSEADCDTDISPLLLILGYGTGVQVWLIPPNGEAQEVLSWRQGTVRVLRILPTPIKGDCFAAKRPLIALCDSASPGPAFCSLSFISIRGGEQVKSIKFKNPILDVLANKRSVVVSFSERFAVFDAGTLEDRMAVTTCYPCPCPLGGSTPINPLALGDRWLAYADKKLNPSKRSSGGCESEGQTSYTATVLHAAKSLSKGLRGLGESVAQSLAGTRGTSQSPSPPHSDLMQPGVVTVLDIEGLEEEDGQDAEEPCEPTVAHFIAHSDAVTALKFDASGLVLVTADRRGHDFHVFRLNPHPCGPALASVHHLYVLHRGDTTAKVQDIALSGDARWAAVSTLRGTTHVFAVAPYGGPAGVRTHTQPRLVNRLSRFHRSAGLPIHAAKPASPVGEGAGAWFPNPRLPPFPQPTVCSPLAQLRPNANLATHTITRTSSGRQRLSSLSEDGGAAGPLLARAAWGAAGAGVGAAAGAGRGGGALALYLMTAGGNLLHLLLRPRPASGVPKEKICDDSPIEVEVEAIAQWPLRRPPAAADLLAPLPHSNPLLQPLECRRCSELCASAEERWLAQVEIVTHAGPHRRLWMGPQFVFKTYNATGSNSSLSEAEAVEVESVARSNPVNMPAAVPILVDSGSASSLEHSPSDSFRRKSLLSEPRAASVCDVRLREDLAEAMKEDHGCRREEAGRVSPQATVALAVDPQGTVVRAVPALGPQALDPDDYTQTNSDEATFRPVLNAPASLPPPPLPSRPLPATTTIPVQSVTGDIYPPMMPDCDISYDSYRTDRRFVEAGKDVREKSRESTPDRSGMDLKLNATKEKPLELIKKDSQKEEGSESVATKIASEMKSAIETVVDEVKVVKDKKNSRSSKSRESESKASKIEMSKPKKEIVETKIEKISDSKRDVSKTKKDSSDLKIEVTKKGMTDVKPETFEKNNVSSELERKPSAVKNVTESKKSAAAVKKDVVETKMVKSDTNYEASSTKGGKEPKKEFSELKKNTHVEKKEVEMKKEISSTTTNTTELSQSEAVDTKRSIELPNMKSSKKASSEMKSSLHKVSDENKLEKKKSPEIKSSKKEKGTSKLASKEPSPEAKSVPKNNSDERESSPRKDISELKSSWKRENKLEWSLKTESCEKSSSKIEQDVSKTREEVLEIKTEEQAWDMLLNEPEKSVLSVSPQSVNSDKSDDSKSKSKKNRRIKKFQDDSQNKSEDDSFVEIHAIEDKIQPSSGELVSISMPFEEIESSSSYSSKTKKSRSPKNTLDKIEKPQSKLDEWSLEDMECVIETTTRKKSIPSDIEILVDCESKNKQKQSKVEKAESSNSIIVDSSTKDKINKPLASNQESRKSIDKTIDADVKDVYVIDSTKEEFPEIQITSGRGSKMRKKSPQIEKDRKIEEVDVVLEKPPIISWSSIAASKNNKKFEDQDKKDVKQKAQETDAERTAENLFKLEKRQKPSRYELEDEPSSPLSLHEELMRLCKRTDIMVAECDAPSELNFVDEHHSLLQDLPPLDLDFGMDDFKLEVMRDSLLDVNDTKVSSPICKIDIDSILSSIKESTSAFNLIDLEKVPDKKEKGFSVVENDKITSQEVKADDDPKSEDKEIEVMEKSSDDDNGSPASADSDKEDNKSTGASNVTLPSTKQSSKTKKSRRKKK